MKTSKIKILISLVIITLSSCGSNDNTTIASQKCLEISKQQNLNMNDAQIICPCLASKLLNDFQNEPKIIEKILIWDLRIGEDSLNLFSKNLRECIYHPEVDNSQDFSDYSSSQRKHTKEWLKKVGKLKQIKLEDIDKYSECVMNKIERKYSYKELLGENMLNNVDISQHKEVLENLKYFLETCKEEFNN